MYTYIAKNINMKRIMLSIENIRFLINTVSINKNKRFKLFVWVVLTKEIYCINLSVNLIILILIINII